MATGTSYGGPIDASLAGRIAWALRSPLRYAQVRTARFHDDAGFCPDCEVPYCHQHWHPSDTGYGYCPYGYGKDLDPQWSQLARPTQRARRPETIWMQTSRMTVTDGRCCRPEAFACRFGSLLVGAVAALCCCTFRTLTLTCQRHRDQPGGMIERDQVAACR
jgi:hypothetical protein